MGYEPNELPLLHPAARKGTTRLVVGWGVRAAASPPTRSPAQYSPALAPGTTRFGMVRGGIGAALGHAHPRRSLAPACFFCRLSQLCRTNTSTTVLVLMHEPLHRSIVPNGARSAPPKRARQTTTPPSTMSTAWLRSLAGRPPAASQPGILPGVLLLTNEKAHLGAGFPLRCCQRLSLPNVATQHCRGYDNWHTSGPSSPVLSY